MSLNGDKEPEALRILRLSVRDSIEFDGNYQTYNIWMKRIKGQLRGANPVWVKILELEKPDAIAVLAGTPADDENKASEIPKEANKASEIPEEAKPGVQEAKPGVHAKPEVHVFWTPELIYVTASSVISAWLERCLTPELQTKHQKFIGTGDAHTLWDKISPGLTITPSPAEIRLEKKTTRNLHMTPEMSLAGYVAAIEGHPHCRNLWTSPAASEPDICQKLKRRACLSDELRGYRPARRRQAEPTRTASERTSI